MLRVLTVVGARPQFVKAAAMSHVIREKYSDRICEDILHTGQHYNDEMSARFFRELDIPAPKFNLGVGSIGRTAQIEAMRSGIADVLRAGNHDVVLVYGDTNSTLAGALAAKEAGVPLVHVEAGLRSHNHAMPEEENRVLTDRMSTLLFAPTALAVRNLEHEGLGGERVVMCGDVMYDNVLRYSQRAATQTTAVDEGILLTVHRNFNVDSEERLKTILSGVNAAAEALGTKVLFPVHPRTRQHLESMTLSCVNPVEPLSYLQTLGALQRVRLVMTDSGGLQKEAFFCRRPCVVLREETEWQELVDQGAAVLAHGGSELIVEAARRMWDVVPRPSHTFGDGHAAEHIVESMLERRF